jgi:hypothetical protein
MTQNALQLITFCLQKNGSQDAAFLDAVRDEDFMTQDSEIPQHAKVKSKIENKPN